VQKRVLPVYEVLSVGRTWPKVSVACSVCDVSGVCGGVASVWLPDSVGVFLSAVVIFFISAQRNSVRQLRKN